MSSPYIDRSKHAEFTSAVEDHFFGGGQPNLTSAPKGGSSAWNTAQGTLQEGQMNNTASAGGRSMFNAPGQNLPRETGVNYKPRQNAGHTTNQDPFSLADGFPGN